MASQLPFSISKLKEGDKATLEEMVGVYRESYEKDRCVQLKSVVPELMLRMGKTIKMRVKQPSWLFIVAKDENSKKIVGWLALAFALTERKELSEEHVLFMQYALLPDIVAKGKIQGISADLILHLTHLLLIKFKDAREEQLLGKHCILSTLVVAPEYQQKGVASALLSKAISLTEAFTFPIWVQAPESCQRLFEKHLFKVIGEYQLDLNDHVPKVKGKGKAKEVDTLAKHAWKFMVRVEPLEPAIEAYRSSKAFAEREAARAEEEARFQKEKEPAGAKRMLTWIISRLFPDNEAKPESLPGEGIQSSSEENLVNPGITVEDPSAPLLAESSSMGGQRYGAV